MSVFWTKNVTETFVFTFNLLRKRSKDRIHEIPRNRSIHWKGNGGAICLSLTYRLVRELCCLQCGCRKLPTTIFRSWFMIFRKKRCKMDQKSQNLTHFTQNFRIITRNETNSLRFELFDLWAISERKMN